MLARYVPIVVRRSVSGAAWTRKEAPLLSTTVRQAPSTEIDSPFTYGSEGVASAERIHRSVIAPSLMRSTTPMS